MTELVRLSPPPAAHEVPTRLASPFDPGPPHPLARRAAASLQRWLDAQPALAAALAAPGGGKMFGVLVAVTADGTPSVLLAFSGMLHGAWHVDGFAPPLFDPARRDAIWPDGQAALREHDLALRALAEDPRHAATAAALAVLDGELSPRCGPSTGRAGLPPGGARRARAYGRCRSSRAGPGQPRRRRRGATPGGGAGGRPRRARRHRDRARPRARRLEDARAAESRRLLRQVHDAYVLLDARGGEHRLAELFAPGEPAGGAGDCAGAKLIGLANGAACARWPSPSSGGAHRRRAAIVTTVASIRRVGASAGRSCRRCSPASRSPPTDAPGAQPRRRRRADDDLRGRLADGGR
ncbi:MAG: hypothetical protein R2939_22965 [Kofleriaceae bacterium]